MESDPKKEEVISKELSENSLTLAGITLTALSILFTLGDSQLYLESTRFLAMSFGFFALSYEITYFVKINWKFRIIQDKFHQFGFISLFAGGMYLLASKSIIGALFLYFVLIAIGLMTVYQFLSESRAYSTSN